MHYMIINTKEVIVAECVSPLCWYRWQSNLTRKMGCFISSPSDEEPTEGICKGDMEGDWMNHLSITLKQIVFTASLAGSLQLEASY